MICMAAWERSHQQARALIALGILLACGGCAFALDPSLDIGQYCSLPTKPQGSGMGLSISRSIIESHGGRLWAANNSPRGARFCFKLPTRGETLDLAVPADRSGPADGLPSNDATV
jgi:hypothetical protein